MPESKIKLTFEQQIVMSLLIFAVCVLCIGMLIVPIFNTQLAIEMNHAFIAFLPDSFGPIKFSGGSELSQKGQLVFRNLALLPFMRWFL